MKNIKINQILKFIVLTFMIFEGTIQLEAQQIPDYKNPELSIDKRVADLVNAMTLEEKCMQVTGTSIDNGQESLPANERLGIPPFVIVHGPVWLQISSSGQLGGTPGNSNEGLNTFVVQADDGHGNKTNTTIEIIVKIPKGIAESEKSKISVYPVPVQNKLNIKGINKNVKYQIFNVSGVKIKKGFVEQNIINVESISPGSYILKLEDLNFNIVKI